jgi:hypothetical protein
MIDPLTEDGFPNIAVKAIGEVLPFVDEDCTLYKRPLRPTDPNYALSVYGTLWQPEEDSFEIGHAFSGEPTLQNYQIGIQSLIKDGDTERALAVSSILSSRIRAVLYRNAPMRLALGSLYVQDDTSRESMRRWGIRSQRFMSNDIEGKFVTISVLDLWIETETT